ncbi:VOC family protein [Spirosoma sp. SC4-14]|uniref:VOC family protein n=1 Tax=Spirosoma sp. SC4-14 TaxID=3128900 RepID=UPI0030CDD3AA
MEPTQAILKNVWPYQQDKMNLPVNDLETAIPFYERVMGFSVISRSNAPTAKAILSRDDIQIGLAENGGDPTQDGCFFDVDHVENAYAELKANGLTTELSGFSIQKYGETTWRVFFVVAPDGLCYCYGQRQVG